jgi:hypothetical protein
MTTALRLLTVALLSMAAFAKNAFIDETKQTVVFIFAPAPDGSALPLGTGFIAGVKHSATDAYFTYLVTAKHVIVDSAGAVRSRLFIRMNKRDGGSEFLLLETRIAEKNVLYTHPTDGLADIAVVPVAISNQKYDYKVVQDEAIPTKEEMKKLEISEGSDVFFTGLFLPFFGQGRNYPVVRFGKVSLIPDEKIPWRTDATKPPEMRELFLLETQSFGGNSGSPVFVTVPTSAFGASSLRLIGIMMGTFEQGSPISVIENSATAVFKQNLGIAAVVPAYLLRDILFSNSLMEFRKAQERQMANPK